jgi:hypothetical protein
MLEFKKQANMLIKVNRQIISIANQRARGEKIRASAFPRPEWSIANCMGLIGD